jgi:hypothetical protein
MNSLSDEREKPAKPRLLKQAQQRIRFQGPLHNEETTQILGKKSP